MTLQVAVFAIAFSGWGESYIAKVKFRRYFMCALCARTNACRIGIVAVSYMKGIASIHRNFYTARKNEGIGI